MTITMTNIQINFNVNGEKCKDLYTINLESYLSDWKFKGTLMQI